MLQNESKLVAVILAGGVGTRMGTTGAQIPKVYLPVGLEPVINRPVFRSLEIDEVEKIYVLTRKKHPDLPNVDLEQWAETWRSLWFKDDISRVEIAYEEELEKLPINNDDTLSGAIIALAKIGNHFRETANPPSHVIIMAGDNFLDSNITPLVRASDELPESLIIATRTIANRAIARNRFGVVEMDQAEGYSRQVIDYKEKPDTPQSSDVSIGLYIFPLKILLRVEEYLAYVLETFQSDLEEKRYRTGAPGYFIEWLAGKQGSAESVRAVPFEDGTWVDVGTPASFLTAIVKLSKNLIERPQSTRDLDVLESTKDLSDKYYFLCHRARISRTEQNNIISLYFQGDDSIATLNKLVADGKHVIDVNQIVDKNKKGNYKFWKILNNPEPSEFSPNNGEPLELESPLLISGGIFLIDRAGDQAYQRGSALVPLLIRDFGAPIDAGRLTTASGRMDKLDLIDVCVSEHAEEMIFFGSIDTNPHGSARILICTPPQWRDLARETILTRLSKRENLVPLLDPNQIEFERREGVPLVTVGVETFTLAPPPKHNWKVLIYYRDSKMDKWQLRHEYKNFVLIPDQKSATLEFRLLWLSAITSTGKIPVFNGNTASLGRLFGIVDGDGYSRTALMVKAQGLVDYIKRIKQQSIEEILFASDNKEKPALDAIAVTDGSTGRFVKSGRKLPLAPLTTSVSFFAELLDSQLKISDGN